MIDSRETNRNVWTGQPKKSMMDLINDDDMPAEEKLKLVLSHNQCLSEYCHILRDALQNVHSTSARAVIALNVKKVSPPIAHLQATFVKLQEIAAEAVHSKIDRSESPPETPDAETGVAQPNP